MTLCTVGVEDADCSLLVMLFDHPDADFDFEAKCSDRIAQSLFLRKILSPQGSGFASLGFGFYNGGLGLVLSRF